MKHRRRIDIGWLKLIVFLLILVGTSGCDQAVETNRTVTVISNNKTGISNTASPAIAGNPNNTSTHNDSLEWQTRWIRGIPCKMPCWEGMTPDVTTLDQADNLLSTNPLMKNVQKHINTDAGIEQYNNYISWNWVNITPFEGYASFITDSSTLKLERIRPNNHYPYKVKQVMEGYGEPSHIIARGINYSPKTTGYSLTLIYLNDGFALYLQSDNFITLNEETQFDTLYIFEPDQAHLGKIYPEAKAFLKKWEGFKDFEYYCDVTAPLSTR